MRCCLSQALTPLRQLQGPNTPPLTAAAMLCYLCAASAKRVLVAVIVADAANVPLPPCSEGTPTPLQRMYPGPPCSSVASCQMVSTSWLQLLHFVKHFTQCSGGQFVRLRHASDCKKAQCIGLQARHRYVQCSQIEQGVQGFDLHHHRTYA